MTTKTWITIVLIGVAMSLVAIAVLAYPRRGFSIGKDGVKVDEAPADTPTETGADTSKAIVPPPKISDVDHRTLSHPNALPEVRQEKARESGNSAVDQEISVDDVTARNGGHTRIGLVAKKRGTIKQRIKTAKIEADNGDVTVGTIGK